MTTRQLQTAARRRRALLDAPLPSIKGPVAGLPQSVTRRLVCPIAQLTTSYPWGGVAIGDRFYGDGDHPKRKGGNHDDDSYLSTRDFDNWPSQLL